MKKQTVLFLCPHGAARSLIAAAYCQRLASQHNLALDISFAGTEPDRELAPAVVTRLRAEGLDLPQQLPRLVTQQELDQTDWIISMGCDLEAFVSPATRVTHWPDIPAPSQDLTGACETIQNHLAAFIETFSRS